MVVLFFKFCEIKEKYDVVFMFGYQGGEVIEWIDEDFKLLDGMQVYYFKVNIGFWYIMGGVFFWFFIIMKQCDGQFVVISIELSSCFDNLILGGGWWWIFFCKDVLSLLYV